MLTAQKHPNPRSHVWTGHILDKATVHHKNRGRSRRGCPPVCHRGSHFMRSLCFVTSLPATNIGWIDEEGQIVDRQKVTSPLPVIPLLLEVKELGENY